MAGGKAAGSDGRVGGLCLLLYTHQIQTPHITFPLNLNSPLILDLLFDSLVLTPAHSSPLPFPFHRYAMSRASASPIFLFLSQTSSRAFASTTATLTAPVEVLEVSDDIGKISDVPTFT